MRQVAPAVQTRQRRHQSSNPVDENVVLESRLWDNTLIDTYGICVDYDPGKKS